MKSRLISLAAISLMHATMERVAVVGDAVLVTYPLAEALVARDGC
jgi:hypothetical protein